MPQRALLLKLKAPPIQPPGTGVIATSWFEPHAGTKAAHTAAIATPPLRRNILRRVYPGLAAYRVSRRVHTEKPVDFRLSCLAARPSPAAVLTARTVSEMIVYGRISRVGALVADPTLEVALWLRTGHDAVASGQRQSSALVSSCIELIIRVMRLEVGLDAGKVGADMPVKVRRPDDGIGARIDHAPGSVTAGERIATV